MVAYWLAAWRSGYRRSSYERSYPTPGPVSTGMGDRLWAVIGLPSLYVTSQLGKLSFASLWDCLIEYQLRLWYWRECHFIRHVNSRSGEVCFILLYPVTYYSRQ